MTNDNDFNGGLSFKGALDMSIVGGKKKSQRHVYSLIL